MKLASAVAMTILAVTGSVSFLAAADELTLVSLNPASGAVNASAANPTGSIDAILSYNLESAEEGKISVYTAGVQGNGAVTGKDSPIFVKKGRGQVAIKFSVQCSFTTAPKAVPIVNIRYALFDQKQGGPLVKTLVEKFQTVNYTFCGPEQNPATPPSSRGGRPTATFKVTLPDITIRRGGLTIGNKFAGWGSTVNLTEKEAALQSNGNCSFNLSYAMQEAAGAAAGPVFVNRFKVDDTNVVSVNSALSLHPSEGKVVNTQAYLPAGSHRLVLYMDNDSNVAETNEANNNFQINYTLSCGKP